MVEEDLRQVRGQQRHGDHFPIIATCHVTVELVGSANLYFLLVIKLELEKYATREPDFKVCGHSFFFSLKLDGLQPLYILRKTQNVPQTTSTASR